MEKYYIDFIKSKTKETVTDIEKFISENKGDFEKFVKEKENTLAVLQKIRELNRLREKELKGFVIDDIWMSEGIIKTMAVAYSMAEDDETIPWIDINNQVVIFSKYELGVLIKKGSNKVKEVYFKYRQLKDEVLKNEKKSRLSVEV